MRDERTQLPKAESLLHAEFLILSTVLMETVWVLVSNYKMSRDQVADRLVTLLSHPNAVVESGGAVKFALAQYRAGAGFADMIHVALAEEAEASSFATFDRGIGEVQLKGLQIALETLT